MRDNALIDRLRLGVPDELRRLNTWLCWRKVARAGSEKFDKIPHYPNGVQRHGEQGSEDDRSMLGTFDTAIAQIVAGRFDGVGVAMLGQGYTGLDFDGCVDDNGAVDPVVLAMVEGTYCEKSPSGRGIRAFYRGELPTGVADRKDPKAETFCRKGFLTVTGNRINGEDIAPLPDMVVQRLAAIFGASRQGQDRRERLNDAKAKDAVLARLFEREMVRRDCGGGKFEIDCSFANEHTTAGGAASTVYFLPFTNGFRRGHFDCKHSHCARRTDADFLAALGLAYEQAQPKDEAKTEKPPEAPETPRFTRNQHGQIKATLGNIVRALRRPEICGWRLARDLFRDEIVKAPYSATHRNAWEPLVDDDYTAIRHLLEEMRDPFMPIGLEMTRHCVSLVALENAFDSALQWLNAIKWDGMARVELSLVNCFGASDTPYVRAVGRYLWTALAGRVLSPGVQADMAPIAVGYQGLKKSRTIAAIAPYPDYFAEVDLSVDNDDLARLMRGKVIAELAELQGLRNRELEHIKALISRSIDQWIPKYKEMSASYARRGIFFGSTNDDEFLSDQTGNRRWLPFTCGTCDPMAMAADRDQLWAEGAVLFKDNGIAWQGAERLARFEHEQFMVSDPWDSSLAKWLGHGGRDVDTPFTVADALEFGIGLDMQHAKPADQMRLIKILKRFGYRTPGYPEKMNERQARFWRKKT